MTVTHMEAYDELMKLARSASQECSDKDPEFFGTMGLNLVADVRVPDVVWGNYVPGAVLLLITCQQVSDDAPVSLYLSARVTWTTSTIVDHIAYVTYSLTREAAEALQERHDWDTDDDFENEVPWSEVDLDVGSADLESNRAMFQLDFDNTPDAGHMRVYSDSDGWSDPVEIIAPEAYYMSVVMEVLDTEPIVAIMLLDDEHASPAGSDLIVVLDWVRRYHPGLLER